MLLVGSGFAAKRLTLVLLNHPLETAVQLFLAVLIPLANFRMWRSLKRDDHRFSMIRGLLSGAAIGTALTITAVCTAALICGSETLQSRIGTTFETGFSTLNTFSFVSMLVAMYQVNRFRLARDFSSFSRSSGDVFDHRCHSRGWRILRDRSQIILRALGRKECSDE